MNMIKMMGYACGWGAKHHGCKDGAKSLKNSNIEKFLPNLSWQDIYTSPLENSTNEPLLLVEDYCTNLSKNVEKAIKNNEFPITIGGDHSMAMGTWSGVTTALKAAGEFGLIWFDAHMDSHTPSTSHTGRHHGMPLASLLGRGEASLCNIGAAGAKLNPEHICLIGIRSFEEEEEKLLRELGVKIFFMEDVKKHGLEKVILEAINIVQKAKKGFGISIDIDAFDPSVAPGTGCHEEEGIDGPEFFGAIKTISDNEKFKALEIAEYDPSRDKQKITLELIHKILQNIVT